MAGEQAEPLVVDIVELARLLKISVRIIKYRRAAGTFPIPEVRGLDRKLRWSRKEVQAFVDRGGVIPRMRRAS